MTTSADQEYKAAMQKMQHAMMQANDSDPAMAWTKKMIAHHQGGIDMSHVVLKHSKDDDIRKEAQKTIEKQQKDIKTLQAKIKDHAE